MQNVGIEQMTTSVGNFKYRIVFFYNVIVFTKYYRYNYNVTKISMPVNNSKKMQTSSVFLFSSDVFFGLPRGPYEHCSKDHTGSFSCTPTTA
jgi:hypothetical protein